MRDDGSSPLINSADTSIYQSVNNTIKEVADQNGTLYVSENETRYPGSTFSNIKIIILTNTRAASGGDTFPNAFLGDNLDKDLGNGVTVKILGDIDGRLQGSANGTNSPAKWNSNRIPNVQSGPDKDKRIPLIPFEYYESPQYVAHYSDRPLTVRDQYTAIDKAPTLVGRNGGNPLSGEFEDTIWPDLGFIPHPDAPLTGDVRGPPDPTVQGSWRDRWLEEAIRESLLP